MAENNRTTGLVGYSGMKVPVRVATTAAITLSGLQTIDGVTVVADDRVLVKDQASSVNNGIYVADTGTWERAKDADGTYDWRQGTLVVVAVGTTNAGAVFRQTTADPITVGSSSLVFSSMGLLSTPVPVVSGGTGGTTGNTALTNLTATRTETGAAAVAAITILRRFATPEDFGAVGDGVTNDATALTNFLNAVMTDSMLVEGRLQWKIYAIASSLPTFATSGKRLIGQGPDFRHSVGSSNSGTIIRAIAGATGTMFTIAPTEGASAQGLSGIVVEGITCDGNSIASKGVILRSIHRSRIDIAVRECTTTNIELNVATTLGETTSAQFNRLNFHSWSTINSGIPLRIIGTATGNWSLNNFERVDLIHYDQMGMIVENADNNQWDVLRIFRAGGGSAANSAEWRGGATTAQSARNETVFQFTATVAGICKGTGTYTVGAQNIAVGVDKGNSTPSLTVETGATGFDNSWRQTTPTPVPGSGAFSTVAAVVRTFYPALTPAKFVLINGYVTITTFGTAGGTLTVPLPVTNGASAVASFNVHTNDGTPLQGFGSVAAGAANLVITRYDGATLCGANRIVAFSGTIELQ